MVVEGESDTTFVDGVRYTADWLHKYTRIEQRPTEPWPWPDAAKTVPLVMFGC